MAFVFNTESKGQIAKSSDYITVKKKFKFDYYSLSFQNVLNEKIRVKPKGLPDLFSCYIIPKNLTKGYLYLFYEKKDGAEPEEEEQWEEYYIHPNSLIRNTDDGSPQLDEDGKRQFQELDADNGYYYRVVKKQQHPDNRCFVTYESIDNPADFIEFSTTDIVWVAYSPVQWSADYLKKTMENKKRREMRFQKLNVAEWLKKGKQYFTGNVADTIWELPWEQKAKNPKIIDYRSEGSKFNFYSYKTKGDTKDPDTYYFTLNAPINMVSDCIVEIDMQTEDFVKLTDSLMFFDSEANTDDKEQYNALYVSAMALYHLLYTKGSKMAKYAKDKLIQYEKLDLLLAISERTKLKNKLLLYRDSLKALIESDYYQHTLMDFYDNIPPRIIEGKNIALKHMLTLMFKPSKVDRNLLLPNEVEQWKKRENRWDKFVIDSYFIDMQDSDGVTQADVQRKMAETLNKKELIDNWDVKQNSNLLRYLLNDTTTFDDVKNAAWFGMKIGSYVDLTIGNLDMIVTTFGNIKLGKTAYFQVGESIKTLSSDIKKKNVTIESIDKMMDDAGLGSLLKNRNNLGKLDDELQAKGASFLKTRDTIKSQLRSMRGKLLSEKGVRYQLETEVLDPLIVNNYKWKSFVRNLAIFDLTYNTINLMESLNKEDAQFGTNLVSIVCAGSDFAAIQLSIISDARKAMGLDDTLFVLRGKEYTAAGLSGFIAKAGGGFVAAADLFYAYKAYQNEEEVVAALYVTSSALTVGGVVLGVCAEEGVGILGISAAVAGILAIVICILVVVVAIAIWIFSDDEFKSFFKNCVLSGKEEYRIPKGKYKTAREVAIALFEFQYIKKEEKGYLQRKFDTFGRRVNMGNFIEMADVILSFSSPVCFEVPHIEGNTYNHYTGPFKRTVPTRNIFKKWFAKNKTDSVDYYLIRDLDLGIPIVGGLWNTASFYHEAYIYPFGTGSSIRIRLDDRHIRRFSEKPFYNLMSGRTTYYFYFQFDMQAALNEVLAQQGMPPDYSDSIIYPQFVFMGYFIRNEDNLQDVYPSYMHGIPRFFGIKIGLLSTSTYSISSYKLKTYLKTKQEIINQ